MTVRFSVDIAVNPSWIDLSERETFGLSTRSLRVIHERSQRQTVVLSSRKSSGRA
jgi:hypothetical protein